jgi:hypothetical protein
VRGAGEIADTRAGDAGEIADTRAGDAGLSPSLRVKADHRRENLLHT